MDTFMDKLAQKFTAGEMIKANSAADLAELENMKKQMEQYEQCLQEMRQVHLKNAETVEKISTLLEESMNKIQEVQKDSISTSDLEKRLEIILGANFDVKLSESMDSLREYIKQQDKDKEERADKCYEKIIVELAQQNLDLETKFSQQMVALEKDITNKREEFGEKLLQRPSTIVEEKLVQQQSGMLDEKLAKQQNAILEEMDGVRAHIAARINEMKNAKNDFSELKSMLESSQAADKEATDTMIRELQDYVHKEDVKVYRNVQAVVVEQGEKNEEQFGNINKKLTSELGLVTKLAGAALAFSIISVLMQLLIRFGIF